MPKYATKMVEENLPTEAETKKLIFATDDWHLKWLLGMYYLSGGRSMEVQHTRKKNFEITDTYLKINLETEKLGSDEKGDFKIRRRTLIFPRGSVFVEAVIYVVLHSPDDEKPIWRWSDAWARTKINEITKRVLGRQLCAYHFRHARFSTMSEKGASISEMLQAKGTSLSSLEMYLHAKPFAMNADGSVAKMTEIIKPPKEEAR